MGHLGSAIVECGGRPNSFLQERDMVGAEFSKVTVGVQAAQLRQWRETAEQQLGLGRVDLHRHWGGSERGRGPKVCILFAPAL